MSDDAIYSSMFHNLFCICDIWIIGKFVDQFFMFNMSSMIIFLEPFHNATIDIIVRLYIWHVFNH